MIVHGPVSTWKSRLAELSLCWYGQNLANVCSVKGISGFAMGLRAKRLALSVIVHDPKTSPKVHDLVEGAAEGRMSITKVTTTHGISMVSSVMFTMNRNRFRRVTDPAKGDQS